MSERTMEKARQVVHRLSEWYFAEGVDNDPDSPIDREDLHALHELVRTAETIAMIAGEPVPVDTGFWSATPEPGGEGGTLESRAYDIAHWIAMEARVAESLGRSVAPIEIEGARRIVALASARPTPAALRSEAQGEVPRDPLALELRGVISDLLLCVDALDGRDGADVASELAIAQMRLREIDTRRAARRGEGGGE